MLSALKTLSIFTVLAQYASAGSGSIHAIGQEEALEMQKSQLNRLTEFLGPPGPPGTGGGPPPPPGTGSSSATISFANPKAAQFFVDGTKIPDVNFDAGPSWSGLMPISADPAETRKLFFWFWPSNNAAHSDDLIFWTNGGPGCSSLEGFLQENGPISWSWGQAEPTLNPWSWTNLSHVLWVEQPVGTGFSQGKPNITNDDELAAELSGFLTQFYSVFKELKPKNLYLTGESYAGFYVPYIANWIYTHPELNFPLKGIWIADPSLSWGVVQQEIPTLRFVQAHQSLFSFSKAQMASFQNISDTCGYTDYLEENLTYPPKGQLPFPIGVPAGSTSPSTACRIFSPVQRAIGILNPAFNIYRVSDTWPIEWSVLGFPRSTQEFIYFNRTDVQDAIHAPHMEWDDCSNNAVYINRTTGAAGRDQSIPSTLSVLPNVIENSVRTLIVHGLADMILMSEGTRIAIQNMTWNGLQGFQTPIEDEGFTVKNFGIYGNTHTERGLTYVEFSFSGHMTPQFVPWAAFQTIQFLLGQEPSVSQ